MNGRKRGNRVLALVLSIVLALGLVPAGLAADSFETSLMAFPESYRAALRALHAEYPNWKFVPFNTGLEWSDVVAGEISGDKSLVANSSSSSDFFKHKAKGNYDPATGKYVEKDAGWVKTTEAALTYFLDPRNFLNGIHIFQFEMLQYDEKNHTQSGVEAILNGTFMYKTKVSYLDKDGNEIDTEETYSDLIMLAARESQVSPYFLASKIRQELGNNGSPSVSGTYEGYEGIYNFYNIGATSSATPIKNGLSWASSGTTYGRPWTSPRASILGGAQYIGKNYINAGQYTGYLQRFNVNKESSYPLYSHQYMTNVGGAVQESVTTRNAYQKIGILNQEMIFYIPVYKNMPAQQNQVKLSTSASTILGTVDTSSLKVRKEPGYAKATLNVTLSRGDTVKILGCYRADENYNLYFLQYPLWYHVEFTKNGATQRGYVCAEYILPQATVELAPGETRALTAAISPAATGERAYFESTDYRVCTVTAAGTVTAVGEGTAYVRATTSGGGLDTVKIVVKKESTPPPTPNDSPFADVRPSDWFYESVLYVNDRGIMTGTSGTVFSPQLPVNRAMFATLLHRMAGEVKVSSTAPFTDVLPGQYYTDAVNWASQKGIITGTNATTFHPSGNVTREQLALMLHRYAKVIGADTAASGNLTQFSDYRQVHGWAEEAVKWAVGKGILSGRSGKLDPQGSATRAEVAAVVQRFMEKFQAKMLSAEEPELESPVPSVEPSADVSPEASPEPAPTPAVTDSPAPASSAPQETEEETENE